MSDYVKDIQFNLITPGVKAANHKQALLCMAEKAADYLNISDKILYSRLMDKETISSSGIGNGVAIPHLKMRRVRVPFTMLMTLNNEVTCDAPDGRPVDLYGFLISPMEDGPLHLRRLSRISRLLQNEALHKRLRETQDRDVIQSALIDPSGGWMIAA